MLGLGFIPSMLNYIYSLWVRSTYRCAGIGHNFSIHYTCELGRRVAHRVRIGNSVTLGKGSWIIATDAADGNTKPCLVIDDNCIVDRYVQIGARNSIHLERNVMVSSLVLLTDHLHAYADIGLPIPDQGFTEGGRIRIGQGCWIGRGAVIACDSGELILGRNCVVAANAVVQKSFPPYSVIAGNPARLVKQYDPRTKTWVMGSCSKSLSTASPTQNDLACRV